MKRILVVDDNADNRYFLRALLQGKGYQVDEAVHGAQALAKARLEPPDLTISDLLMPELDGYSLLRHWKADARLRGVPFLVYTATYTDPRDERLALALGADAFIVKPAEPDLLMQRIDEALARHDRGEVRPVSGAADEETALLKEYSEVLVRKLEKKAIELEHTNRDLLAEIAERARTEDMLRDSEERFRATFEQAAVGIAHVDADGRFIRVNDRLCAITGYSRDELLQRGFLQLTVPEDRAESDDARHAMLAGTQATYSVEKRYRKKDGGILWADVVTTLARGSERSARYFITVIVDITDRKMLEDQFRQAQKMDAIGRLAGGVAHDFNNLLTIMFACTDQIATLPALPGEVREAVQGINAAAERATALTAKLLGFSRQTMLQPRIVDLNAAILTTASLLHRLIGEDIVLSTTLDPNVDRVRIDPTQLDQIVMNLAVNARDAMPRGGRLTLATANVLVAAGDATHRGCKPGRHVALTIADTGFGMSAEVLGRIFEPFFTTKEAGKGTGLGLAMVFGIVQQSGGCIHVDSAPGAGATFRIYLPSVSEPAARPAGEAAVAGSTGAETILVVEDDTMLRTLAVRALEARGYRVIAASNGEEALKLGQLSDEPVALVLTDVVMPKMSGPELVKRLADRLPGAKVLYMSGYTDDAIVRHGLMDASVALIPKPFTPLGLAQKVREILDRDKKAAGAGR